MQSSVATPSDGTGRKPPGALVLHGIPDNHRVLLLREEDGSASITCPGTAAFLPHMPEDIQAWPKLLLPLSQGTTTLRAPRAPIVNHIADPDLYRETLGQALWIVERMGLPCFNHPEAVLRTTRDGVSQLLQGIPGVVMPKTIRLTPKHPRDFAAAVEEHGLIYPVIVRLTGTQTGVTQTLIESADDWDKVFSIPWGGAEVYLTQYVDYGDANRLYPKLRLAIVGGQILPRHHISGHTWDVHSRDRNPESIGAEVVWMERFAAAVLPDLRRRIEEIARRIGLDYFGIDGCIRPDGALLIFEVNASMSITANTPPFQAAMHPFVQAIRDELAALLREPARWRHQPIATNVFPVAPGGEQARELAR